MNSINQNINNPYYLRKTFKANDFSNAESQEVQLPDMYNIPNNQSKPASFKETVKKADMMGMVYPWLEHPIFMAGTCAGLAYGVDKFSTACGGDYEKSLMGKTAKLGDRIATSKFAKSEFATKVSDFVKSAKNKFNKWTKNSDVINAIRFTPSQPEWSMVKDEMLSQEQRVVHEFTRITDGLQLGVDKPTPGFFDKLFGRTGGLTTEKLALTKEEKALVQGISNKEQAVNTVLLKRLGRSDSEIQRIIGLGNDATKAVKEEILKEMGLTADKLELIKKDNTGKYIKEVKAAAEKVKGKVWIGAGNYPLLGPAQIFERRIGCDEVYNRLHSLSDGATTKTGRMLSKFVQRCHRGFTFGGGKLGVLMFVAPHLVETMIDAKKADPDAKVGTVANGIISAMSWVFTFPLGLKIMHSLTGMQYAGMSKDAVAKYREELGKFNARVTSNEFKTKGEYDTARKELVGKLKALKKPAKPQNLLTKMCKKLGSFLTMDLEQIKSYRNGSFAGNTARKLPSFFKNLGGIPMRLILWGGITMFGLEALITKSTKSVFGKFYDRTKEEENEAMKEQQKQFLKADLQARMLEAQKKKLEAAQAPKIQEEVKNNEAVQQQPLPQVVEQIENNQAQPAQTVENQQASNENIKKNDYIPNQNSNLNISEPTVKTTKRDNYTYIPSQESVFNNQTKTQQQRYIPSQSAANIVRTFDNSGLDGALRRADRAEAKALEVLSGNFNG